MDLARGLAVGLWAHRQRRRRYVLAVDDPDPERPPGLAVVAKPGEVGHEGVTFSQELALETIERHRVDSGKAALLRSVELAPEPQRLVVAAETINLLRELIPFDLRRCPPQLALEAGQGRQQLPG